MGAGDDEARGTTTARRMIVLSLTSLECWPELSHDMRRFGYETLVAMQRMGVPASHYEQFLAWLSRLAARTPRTDA